MQAITVKFLPATNVRGSRLKAYCERGSITIGYPHDIDGDAKYRAAFNALVSKFVEQDQRLYGTPPEKNPWNRPAAQGSTKYGEVFVYTGPLND